MVRGFCVISHLRIWNQGFKKIEANTNNLKLKMLISMTLYTMLIAEYSAIKLKSKTSLWVICYFFIIIIEQVFWSKSPLSNSLSFRWWKFCYNASQITGSLDKHQGKYSLEWGKIIVYILSCQLWFTCSRMSQERIFFYLNLKEAYPKIFWISFTLELHKIELI